RLRVVREADAGGGAAGRAADDEDLAAVPDRARSAARRGERRDATPRVGGGVIGGRAGEPGRPRLAGGGIHARDEEDKLAAGPRAERILVASERGRRERAPAVRLRVVGDPVRERVAAAAA